MASDLRRWAARGSVVRSAEFIVASARLGELHECSVLLRRTRLRAEEIVDEARRLLTEAEERGDTERAAALRVQLEAAVKAYHQVLDAYATICQKIDAERLAILRTRVTPDRDEGLSGVS
ncbi:hypothetical protein [Nonomuraea pusilla]|uniref:Uncharacterized protein n=1 Tax=Nonomuraea pusilla TaxID=46177 RepID=A0A1H8GEG2_9ACTN|nr:hypothetical protein [Nonomuraea pusilla]SEN42541.1 hypothetical protein SAMN05660976_07540 [Nonomuraea pusilla]